ncbi:MULTISPECIES: hypothetical protein [unclassified Synechococcus]|uniref:hypothetical protein n=1 Tax=unclassified Synechococcus TaxID=2626047 RepID=UPI0039B00E5B
MSDQAFLEIAEGAWIDRIFKNPIVVNRLAARFDLDRGLRQIEMLPGSGLPFDRLVIPFAEQGNTFSDLLVGVAARIHDDVNTLFQIPLPTKGLVTVEIVFPRRAGRSKCPHPNRLPITPEAIEKLNHLLTIEPQFIFRLTEGAWLGN